MPPYVMQSMSHLMNTYARLPVSFTHGNGVWLWDSNGKRYLDALSGIAVNTLGHAHPSLTANLAKQANKLIHVSNLYQVSEQEIAAEKLCTLARMQQAFFCNSGCEANEAAIKLARLYGHQQNIDNPAIIVMEKAFHGRTLATLSATGNRKVQAGFEPLVKGFVRVPYNDLDAVQQVAEHNHDVIAVLVEPIQGEGGIRTLDIHYLENLRKICDQYNWLLMLDEVQCGIGRTGKWFAHQHTGILPDVMTLAKGIGSGIPVGVCLAAGKAANIFKPGNHGSTFGGNPLACVAVQTTLAVMEQDQLIQNAATVGEFLLQNLRSRLASVAGVVEIRGQGLMIGIELNRNCLELVRHALDEGLLINVTDEKVIRLLPAIIFTPDEAQQLLDKLCPLIINFLAQGS
uniref:Acetylornithine aminotransferase n=1 Tax=Candidatus Nitrotoga fabula TaxID=2182327 RepID=A0A2X0QZ48_9PROT|nr:Acetylornithine aminotransferase [Candidatus Nitrotoga fabula]